MQHSLRFVAILTATGVLASGAVWLAIYDSHKTPSIEFDGPTFLGLLLTLVGGWLLTAVVGLILYAPGNRSRKIAQAIMTVILCGLAVGLGTGYLLIHCVVWSL